MATSSPPKLAASIAGKTTSASSCTILPFLLRLKKLNNRKAPEICAVTAEMLRTDRDYITQWLTQIFNHVWVTEQPPSDWTRGVILPFWKGKLIWSNHRGITLQSIPTKLFSRILFSHALPAIRSNCHPSRQAPHPIAPPQTTSSLFVC